MNNENPCKHEYLYRGVSEEIELKGNALKPYSDKPFLGEARVGIMRAGDRLGLSELNAKKEHQSSSSLYKHRVLSTTPFLERAIHYALHNHAEEPIEAGFVYKLKPSNMKNIEIKNTKDNHGQPHPENEEYLLNPIITLQDCDFGIIEKIKICRISNNELQFTSFTN